MHHQTSREVQGAELLEPAAGTPYPVRQRIVYQKRPENHEDHIGAEFDPLRNGPRNQGRGNDGKHHLKDHIGLMGNGRRIVRVGVKPDPTQPDPIQIADDMPHIGTKGKTVTKQHPLHGDDPERHETVHDGAQNILAAHHAAVKKREPRGHQHDQRGGGEDPRRIT